MSYDSTKDTIDHIGKVRYRLHVVIKDLEARGLVHDASKLQAPEKPGYDQLQTALKDVVYGTDAYRAALAEAKPVIDHHYAANDHHPEHYPNGVNGMTLMALVEMLCD